MKLGETIFSIPTVSKCKKKKFSGLFRKLVVRRKFLNVSELKKEFQLIANFSNPSRKSKWILGRKIKFSCNPERDDVQF
jgi:hypothetical protein